MTAGTVWITAISVRAITNEWTIIASSAHGFVFH